MSGEILDHEVPIRLGFFFGVLILVALGEMVWPRRPLTVSKPLRWGNNLALVVFNSLVLRLTFPIVAVPLALFAEKEGWGILHRVELPFWLAFAVSVIVLDLLIYLQHVMMHAVPAFWRLHRMHHADLDIDVTTGARFHPLEIMLSMVFKLAAVVAIGAPALAVLIFEILLNGTAMFNHGNLSLPPVVDRVLRWVVVTPDMHRVHHSILVGETNSNFGFNLPWWDRLMMTYRAQPRQGHLGMTIGIDQFRHPGELWLHRLLAQPFRSGEGPVPINKRGGDEA